MLFNANEFILIFLPLTFLVFHAARRFSTRLGLNALAVASMIFYGYGEPGFIALLLTSIAVNYFIGCRLLALKSRLLLITGIALNVLAIGYFKYSSFVVDNLNTAFSLGIDFKGVALPLAISFYTFQQIAFLVDSYQSKTERIGFLEYLVFVSFFPQLIAGPIVHHKDVVHQYQSREKIPFRMISTGLYIYTIGLFKKGVFADFFGTWADFVFNNPEGMTAAQTLLGTLAYMLQIYFDFSGYSDMAIGLGMMFGIILPLNFNSPYKAKSIDMFWRRWHITLSTWLRDYIYIPLGGNRRTEMRRNVNVMTTMLIGGLWHGAGWTFVIWGALHGVGICLNHAWRNLGLSRLFTGHPITRTLYTGLTWLLTLTFVWLTWIPFRAETFQDVAQVLRNLTALPDARLWLTTLPDVSGYWDQHELSLAVWLIANPALTTVNLALLFSALGITLFTPNAMQLGERFKPGPGKALFSGITLFIIIIANLFLVTPNAFIYFRF